MAKSKRRTEMPKEVIPDTVRICLKNYERHRRDAEVLFANSCYPSAIGSLLYSVEELAKVILLLPYYKQKERVPEDEVRKIFRDHQYRFSEFQKFFHQSLPGNPIGGDMMENFAKMMGETEQDYKEQMIYVDWIYGRIRDPTELGQFMITKEKDGESFVKMKFEITKININTVLHKLKQDQDFLNLLNEPKVDFPTPIKIQEILTQYFGEEKIPTKTEISSSKKITIKLDSKHRLVTEEIKQKIKRHLQARYSNYEIFVKLEEM